MAAVTLAALAGCDPPPLSPDQLLARARTPALMPACPGATARAVEDTRHATGEYLIKVEIEGLADCRAQWAARLIAARERFQCRDLPDDLACTHQDGGKGDQGTEVLLAADHARVTLWKF